MPDNVVLVSVQQNESPTYIHIYALPFGLPPHSGHHRAISRAPCALYYVLYMLYSLSTVSIVFMCQFQSPNSSHHYPFPPYPCICPLCLYLYFCFPNKIIYTIFLREGNGTPLQYSCLANPINGGAW